MRQTPTPDRACRVASAAGVLAGAAWLAVAGRRSAELVNLLCIPSLYLHYEQMRLNVVTGSISCLSTEPRL